MGVTRTRLATTKTALGFKTQSPAGFRNRPECSGIVCCGIPSDTRVRGCMVGLCTIGNLPF